MQIKKVFFRGLFFDIISDDFEAAIKELKKWVDIDDFKYYDLNNGIHKSKNLFGYSLKAIKKHLDNTSSDKVMNDIMESI